MRYRSSKRLQTPRLDLLQNERGTSVIELAIIAPVLLVFLAGVTDLGRGWTEKYRLQQAVNRSLEQAQTGRDVEYSHLRTEAAAAAGVPLEQVVQEQWFECSGSSTKRAWNFECPAGIPARYVKLTINGSYAPLFGSMGYLTPQADGTVRLTAHATLRVR